MYDYVKVRGMGSKLAILRRPLWLVVYVLDAVRSSQILIGKQKLGVTFDSDKLGGIDLTKFSKLTTSRASEA